MLIGIVGVMLPSACKKKKEGCTDPISIYYDHEADVDDGSCTYAGTGGNTNIIARAYYHGANVISKVGWVDSAFVKFNVIESPGVNPTDYNLVIAGEVGKGHVIIEGLKPGKYFLYMTAFDSTILKCVTGGTTMFITATSGDLEYPVIVSE